MLPTDHPLQLIMAALHSRCGHYIFALWFLLSIYGRPMEQGRPLHFCPVVSFFLLFFPHLISAVGDWMSTILLHMVWPSMNLERRSEMCCAWLAGNAGPKKSSKIFHLGTIAQLCQAISSQLRHVSTIRKKIVKQQCLPHMSS